MSLEKWVEYGLLRREPTSPGEISDLLGIVERSLADSKVEAGCGGLSFHRPAPDTETQAVIVRRTCPGCEHCWPQGILERSLARVGHKRDRLPRTA
jgi:hypothetical protein